MSYNHTGLPVGRAPVLTMMWSVKRKRVMHRWNSAPATIGIELTPPPLWAALSFKAHAAKSATFATTSAFIFSSYDNIVDHCCHAWNRLIDQPWRIMSIGLRQWAHGS